MYKRQDVKDTVINREIKEINGSDLAAILRIVDCNCKKHSTYVTEVSSLTVLRRDKNNDC